MDYQQKYEIWLQKANDKQIHLDLVDMQSDDIRKRKCFTGELEFGTAGLRGVMDAGTDCMNVYTVASTSSGLAKYLVANGAKKICISYDSRNNSVLFAHVSAIVFATLGLHVVITPQLQPTPYLSFLVRYSHADAGVMITASHNPKEYNGYKVYGSDGCQINETVAANILDYIAKEDPFAIGLNGYDTLVSSGRIEYSDDNVTKAFLTEVNKQSLNNQLDNITVVYSPLNGTGYQLVPKILSMNGLTKLIPVVEQSFPNGNFTTCPKPNPENDETLALGINYAKQHKADVFFATDPDCDRVGVVVRHQEKYIRLSGQEVGILLTDYVLSQKKNNGVLPTNPLVIKTIVTSDILFDMVKDYNGRVADLLTGFKYIGEYITALEKVGKQNEFVIGFEESCGYLVGTHVRDKDAVVASMLICQMTSEYRRRGMTLIDKLNIIFHKYGRYHHRQISYRFDSVDGMEQMQTIMKNLRVKPIKSFGCFSVTKTEDLLADGMKQLPRSDVMIYHLDNKSKIIIRPSGTEPLIKLYLSVVGDDADARLAFDLILKFTDKYFAVKEK